jgi:hypothetical protein
MPKDRKIYETENRIYETDKISSPRPTPSPSPSHLCHDQLLTSGNSESHLCPSLSSLISVFRSHWIPRSLRSSWLPIVTIFATSSSTSKRISIVSSKLAGPPDLKVDDIFHHQQRLEPDSKIVVLPNSEASLDQRNFVGNIRTAKYSEVARLITSVKDVRSCTARASSCK